MLKHEISKSEIRPTDNDNNIGILKVTLRSFGRSIGLFSQNWP